MDMKLWREIFARLHDGETIAVATIAASDGSTPRGAGAKMLVGAGGLLAGTLGGGPAEAMALREAEKTLADGEPRLFVVDMSGTAAAGADLICGGVVRIFVQCLHPGDAETFARLCSRAARGLDSRLLSPVRSPGKPTLQEGADDDPGATAESGQTGACLIQREKSEYLLETIRGANRLVLAGGGHVSLVTARIADIAGFETTVLDDREAFANPARFPWIAPERLLVVPEFRECLREETLGFAVDPACSIAVLTRGHEFDGEVLAQALATPAGYIGMIGSRRKRDIVYERMRDLGFTDADLGRVHCPIGVTIGSETPAEIAVSIVAELIQARRRER